MSRGTSKNSIPRHIEPRKFAQNQVHLAGDLALDAFPRLAEAVIGVDSVKVDLDFAIDADQNYIKTVVGVVEAKVRMQCQRCLESVPLTIACDTHLAVIWSEDEVPALPRAMDPWIVADAEADLYVMVEDEILLNLPYVALHPEQCVESAALRSEPDTEATDSEDKENPFQVLSQLKGKTKK